MRSSYRAVLSRCTLISCLLLSAACSNVQQLQPTLDAIEAVQDIFSETDATGTPATDAVAAAATDTEVAPENLHEDPTETDIWRYIASNLELTQYQDQATVQAEIERFQKHPRTVIHFAENARPFIFHVVNEIEKHQLPLDIALLPAIESAYDPLAYSAGRAAGMWQFIESTGKIYELDQTWWHDDRRDIIASTDAAIRYLSDLNSSFNNDWLLTLAAYNAGPGRLGSAIRANQRAGKPTDFWSLDLPLQTRRYVPKLIALATIIASPEAYGVNLPPVPNEAYFDVVETNAQANLTSVARHLKVEPKHIYKLNPGYNRDFTAPDVTQNILVPNGLAPKLHELLADENAPSYSGETLHTVKKGETLSHIARTYGSSVSELCEYNHINTDTILTIGQKLLVKEGRNMGLVAHVDRSAYKRKVIYQVRSGDSLYGIAAKFNVSVKQLKAWNDAKFGDKNYLYPGDNIRVYVDITQLF